MRFRATRPVIVTGGTGALGRAVVGALLAAGARCRVPYVVDAEAAAFPHKDRVTLVGNCELTSEADVARLYDGVTDLWASIHIAGGFAMGSVDDTDKAGMMHMLNMNFVTCYLCCRAAVQRLRTGRRPHRQRRRPPGAGTAHSAPAWRPTPQARRRSRRSPRRWPPRSRGVTSW